MYNDPEAREKELKETKEKEIKQAIDNYQANIKIENEEFKKQALYNSFISYSKIFSVALVIVGIICCFSPLYFQTQISWLLIILGIVIIASGCLLEKLLLWKAYVLRYIIDNEKKSD